MIRRFKVWLDGKKTHAAAIATVIAVIWLYRHNQCEAKDVIEAVGAALSLMFLRHGLAKNTNKTQTAAEIVQALRDEILADAQPEPPAIGSALPTTPPVASPSTPPSTPPLTPSQPGTPS